MEHDRHRSLERLLLVREASFVLRVSNMTLYRLIKSGALPAVKVGKNYRLRRRDLEAFLAQSVDS